MTVDEARTLLQRRRNDLVVRESDRQRLSESMSSWRKSFDETGADLGNHAAASEILHQLVDYVNKENLSKVEGLVNEGLKAVFHDMDLKFRVERVVLRKQTAYRCVVEQNGVEGSVHSFGGGVWSVISVILKILMNRAGGRFPLVAFDESLAALADSYIGNASRFLRECASRLGMTLVLVTHQLSFADEADRTYQLVPGKEGAQALELKEAS